MRILNHRIGFATNSSSYHSVVIGNSELNDDNDDTERDFGWGWFILKNKQSKVSYITQQLSSNDDLFPVYVKYMHEIYDGYDIDLSDEQLSTIQSGYVDHQSIWELPSFPRIEDSVPFLKYFVGFLMGDVIILGGNDNDDDKFEEYRKSNEVFDRLTSMASFLARHENGSIFTFFTHENGEKLVIDMDGSFSLCGDVHLATPTLVDIKITDFCNKGCRFCYQSSTNDGKHANFDDIKSIIDACSRMGVFEISIGGGEPTQHPQFEEIVRYISSKGMTPNFTTKNISYSPINIYNLIGGYSYSVGGSNEQLLRQCCSRHLDGTLKKMSVHIITHTVSDSSISKNASWDSLYNSYKYWKLPVILLGFKSVGRAKTLYHYNGREWSDDEFRSSIDFFISCRTSIAVDTACAKRYKSILDEKGVDSVRFYSDECMQSCAIDAVNMTMTPSSYHTDISYPISGVTDYVDMYKEMQSRFITSCNNQIEE